ICTGGAADLPAQQLTDLAHGMCGTGAAAALSVRWTTGSCSRTTGTRASRGVHASRTKVNVPLWCYGSVTAV
ncbi:MAG TPA: hypothetical protein VLV86_21190, partial [Vicinamibacterales bacterium]|nr:hypothetical protein [Vicinamibacterales bacterium]